jgi:hypothetical protein
VVMLVMTRCRTTPQTEAARRGGAERRQILPSPCVIAVDGRWWGHGVPSRDRVGDWAGKEEVSKKDRKRKSTSSLLAGG